MACCYQSSSGENLHFEHCANLRWKNYQQAARYYKQQQERTHNLQERQIQEAHLADQWAPVAFLLGFMAANKNSELKSAGRFLAPLMMASLRGRTCPCKPGCHGNLNQAFVKMIAEATQPRGERSKCSSKFPILVVLSVIVILIAIALIYLAK